jgi:ArsR family transcriptional regulator
MGDGMENAELATHIDECQYRFMSMSLPLADAAQAADPAGDPAAVCCSPLLKQPISAEDALRIAPLLKALADPVRLRLLSLVASYADQEACVCDLNDAFRLSQPTISHHLKVLHEAGLLDRTKRGVWVYYRVRAEALASLGTLLGGVAG